MSTPRGPKPIEAKSLHHPGRWVTATILLSIVALFIYSCSQNEAFGWDTYFQYLFDTRIAEAALHTIALTVLAMLIGVVLGQILAILRMSPNPVLSAIAWSYLWIFRGTPVYVQLVFWGLAGNIFKVLNLGIAEIDLESALRNTFFLAVLGLGLNEAAYMAEIVRSGIQAVPPGQIEASKALGMSWWTTIRRTILPQARRIILPPTGNEFISLLKTTSLVVAIPYSMELYGRAMDIANALFDPIPLLLVAATWYLVITSLLMVGQHYLEIYYDRGATKELTARQLSALADAEGTLPKNINIVPETPKRK
ncbi:amino acid ABC transporter permease [Corynebacterium sp. ES2794-CONJ1]|uniref:amino acid ABC transporter permease n=1 Tax=unclassified Corynebacterium TaxID=2624378 RepID=UPI0021682CDB|nr:MULTISPECIES: amino acid ABC transporter permease [unclassified Corynebacterium]MCS4490732.1 amino acid ABC transporter permease [Corynebacterium sp. ES2775-CONJ]MCS4492534.1 amino acid ABC transporter permease [Corynebacterium sp. ES2715-CONJ3]MCS4532635.1 amino acid ABC transporter permease [Corynebacterium sp. ES2730-CONJ]MCU9520030.1 amino acid ABC transporter permease [Corynebacterium sp. ES2794-CONJ1]